jgi:hypothetical protein
MAGILTHYYSSCSNFSDQMYSILINAFKTYADIPTRIKKLKGFKGVSINKGKN